MAETISTLADLSTVWLILLSFVFCLIPLALVGGTVYGLHKLLVALPPILKQGQEATAAIADGTDRASRRIAAPFITVSAYFSQVKDVLRNISQIGRRKA